LNYELVVISLQDWVQFEEVADIEEKALSALFESGPSVSSSAATLPESLTKLPDVIVCPEASESEKGDVSRNAFVNCNIVSTVL